MKIDISFRKLETERLILRELKPTDAPEIFLLRSDGAHNQFLDRPRAVSVQDAEAFIIKINTLVGNKESLFWAIQVKKESALAGTVALWHFDEEANKAEIGYELLPLHQDKGFMHEAINKVLDFAFNSLRLSAIEAWTHPENIKSSSLLQKVGFTRDEEPEKVKPADAIENIYTLKSNSFV